ncbi:hypothetical protein DL93DRAFT_1226268 [Clavulina sp. PMI_390]|nr:hypothetical protein DL93DRAFT_1226268 [Clavulina sp. PMI_390]
MAMASWLFPRSHLVSKAQPPPGALVSVEDFKGAVAAPPKAAIILGFIISVVVMGIVTVQTIVYSTRWYKEQRMTVIIINVLVLGNLICLAVVGEALYHSIITIFKSGVVSVSYHRRYLLMLFPNASTLLFLTFYIFLSNVFFSLFRGLFQAMH